MEGCQGQQGRSVTQKPCYAMSQGSCPSGQAVNTTTDPQVVGQLAKSPRQAEGQEAKAWETAGCLHCTLRVLGEVTSPQS